MQYILKTTVNITIFNLICTFPFTWFDKQCQIMHAATKKKNESITFMYVWWAVSLEFLEKKK